VNHALVTIISSVPHQHVEHVRGLIDALGNPATPTVRAKLEALANDNNGSLAIHFASLIVFPAADGTGHLVLEFSGDGNEKELLQALAQQLGDELGPIFAHARDRGSRQLHDYWQSHSVPVGHGYFDNPGLVFAGTPGLSVRRIKQEHSLVNHLAELLDEQAPLDCSALEQIAKARMALAADPAWRWALIPEHAEALQPERTLSSALPSIALSVARTYLWPLMIPPLLVFIVWTMSFGMDGLMRALVAALVAGILSVFAGIGMLGAAYAILRRREQSESPDDVVPDPRTLARAIERENHAAQNHLAAISAMKPGLLRQLTLRFALAGVFQVATKVSRPGLLGGLGTIHFARWVMVPKTGDLLFLSNYGGSWESYLEDFITKAHNGLTAVWSNTQGFPRSSNLVNEGARNGARFKRWARRQQVPTGFWYSAYPDLTTTHIRNNAAIRQGLGTILTEEEATRWLSLFGSQPRPATALEAHRIQCVVFGGLGFLRFGMCVGFRLSDDQRRAKEWLASVLPNIAFGDGRKHKQGAVILALAAPSLPKLGLQHDSILTFPQAFLDGMCAPWRSRILGDEYANSPDNWKWGNPEKPVDGLLLLYAASQADLDTLESQMRKCLSSLGHTPTVQVRFVPLPDKNVPVASPAPDVEPFGFVDGVSQPIIRGTYKALRGADPIHIVEPGEFILGYPDNSGYLPATPTLSAIYDPKNILPITTDPQLGFARPIVNEPRDIGRNGSFLAVRQLQQHVDVFNKYCASSATKIQNLFPDWIGVTDEFVAAKLIGRWKDGSSLVRFPYRSATEDSGAEHPMVRTAAGTTDVPDQPAPLPAVPATETGRAAPIRPADVKTAARGIVPDNDFLFGAEDPQGLRCPYGAHIRRTNPRESFEPASNEQLAITNRHRILRMGRLYSGEHPDTGLFFMCLNSDLERQFEFVQQTWVEGSAFHGLTSERDPLLGNRHAADEADFTIPTRNGPVRLRNLPEFVSTRGGGYFFVPGKTLLEYLANLHG
jgi:deferrochelatase/peroxidase EfeB